MASALYIVYSLVLMLECFAIFVANIFSICVIWRRITVLKRTYYLLLNQSCADLMVGVQSTLTMGSVIFYLNLIEERHPMYYIFRGGLVCSLASSIFSLVVIAIERLWSVLWPIFHRTAKTRYYYYGIALAWLPCAVLIPLLLFHAFGFIGEKPFIVFYVICILFALLIISFSYFTLWCRLRPTVACSSNRRTAAQDRKLSMTLFIVTVLSLIFWLPSNIALIFWGFEYRNSLNGGTFVTTALQLANSFANPIVYSFRMPVFKEALKKCFKNKIKAGRHATEGTSLNHNAVALTSFKPRAE